jgi:hypothetical protein
LGDLQTFSLPVVIGAVTLIGNFEDLLVGYMEKSRMGSTTGHILSWEWGTLMILALLFDN